MANENMEEALKFLEDNPEELKRLNSNDTRVGKSTISRFLEDNPEELSVYRTRETGRNDLSENSEK